MQTQWSMFSPSDPGWPLHTSENTWGFTPLGGLLPPHTYTLGRSIALPTKWVKQPFPWPPQDEIEVVEQANLLPSSTLWECGRAETQISDSGVPGVSTYILESQARDGQTLFWAGWAWQRVSFSLCGLLWLFLREELGNFSICSVNIYWVPGTLLAVNRPGPWPHETYSLGGQIVNI